MEPNKNPWPAGTDSGVTHFIECPHCSALVLFIQRVERTDQLLSALPVEEQMRAWRSYALCLAKTLLELAREH